MSLPPASEDVSPALAKILGVFGRFLITLGVLLLLFAGFQLWGTGVAEARAQEDLAQRFEARQAEHRLATIGQTDEVTAPAEQSPPQAAEATPLVVPIIEHGAVTTPPEPGEPVGVIEIPAIGVRKTVVEGTSRDVLRSGPGHYRSTPLPGQAGNTAIAGHRTTHGAPFFDIDLLVPGDEIQVETVNGTATYLVEAHDDGDGGQVGHLIVDPSEIGVIADKGDDRLTLTACHPKYSAKQRIIVTATLVSEPEPQGGQESADVPAGETPAGELPGEETGRPGDPTGQTDKPPTNEPVTEPANESLNEPVNVPSQTAMSGPPDEMALGSPPDNVAFDDRATVAASLGWQPEFAPATVLWALATAAVAAAGWVAGRLWRRVPSYAMAVPPATLTLFYCFANLEKFIPAV